jgi:hypothetical protein
MLSKALFSKNVPVFGLPDVRVRDDSATGQTCNSAEDSGERDKEVYIARVMTHTPRKREIVAGEIPNCLMKIGVTVVMDNAGKIENRTKQVWLRMTMSFHPRLQFRGSLTIFEGVGTRTCGFPDLAMWWLD